MGGWKKWLKGFGLAGKKEKSSQRAFFFLDYPKAYPSAGNNHRHCVNEEHLWEFKKLEVAGGEDEGGEEKEEVEGIGDDSFEEGS